MMTEEAKMPKTGRDEKGLTMGHRAMLRLLMVYNQVGSAASKIGDCTDIGYLLGTPMVASAVQDLLVFSTEVAKKIGTPEELAAYLNDHASEDNAFFEKQRKTHYDANKRSVAEKLHDLVDGPPCEVCGETTCKVCDSCHSCGTHDSQPPPPALMN